MKYGIYHEYDVDGNFGDSVSQEDLIAICDSKEIAEAYAKRWDKTHVYKTPYAPLYCGTLTVMPFDVPVITKENEMESPWDWTWCPDDIYDDDEDEEGGEP